MSVLFMSGVPSGSLTWFSRSMSPDELEMVAADGCVDRLPASGSCVEVADLMEFQVVDSEPAEIAVDVAGARGDRHHARQTANQGRRGQLELGLEPCRRESGSEVVVELWGAPSGLHCFGFSEQLLALVERFEHVEILGKPLPLSRREVLLHAFD